jgi:hypothetical protein
MPFALNNGVRFAFATIHVPGRTDIDKEDRKRDGRTESGTGPILTEDRKRDGSDIDNG